MLREGELTLRFLRFDSHPVHRVPTYYFQMVHSQTQEELGGINLRQGSMDHILRYAGHIGFSVHPAHRGRRFASRSLVLLLSVARKLNFRELWLTCDPDNIASKKSLEFAGAEFVETVDVPTECIIHQTGHPRKSRYRIDLLSPQRCIAVKSY